MSRLMMLVALMPAVILGGSADAQTPGILRAMPSNAGQLDAYLDQQQYLELRQALSKASNPDELIRNMNWERSKMESGATAFIGFMFAGDLWRVGDKENALKILLYTYAQISLDGTKCDDASAPGHRIDQLFSTFSATWKSVATVPPERRPALVDVALSIEQGTASKRGEDEFLCRNGLAEIGDALRKNGERPLQEAPPQPGQVGKTMILPTNPDFKPKFVSRDVWLPKQTALRASMRDTLTQIVDKFTASNEPNSPTSANITELRSTALAATRQGHPEQALPIYDTLTALEHVDPQVFQEAHLAAMRAHDFRRSAMYGERQLSSEPNNFSVMEQIAFSYHMSGDLGNFESARDRVFKFRLSATDIKIPSNRLLFEYFGAGNALVFSNECYRADPPFRIKYRFDVMDPAPGTPTGLVLRAFLVLENPEADDKVAKELTGDARPHFSLDAFEKNKTVHKTIQSYIGEPKYEMVKARVAQYLNDGAIISSSTAPEGTSFNADCSLFPGQN